MKESIDNVDYKLYRVYFSVIYINYLKAEGYLQVNSPGFVRT